MNIEAVDQQITKSRNAVETAMHTLATLTDERAAALLADDTKALDKIDRDRSAAQASLDRQRERQELLSAERAALEKQAAEAELDRKVAHTNALHERAKKILEDYGTQAQATAKSLEAFLAIDDAIANLNTQLIDSGRAEQVIARPSTSRNIPPTREPASTYVETYPVSGVVYGDGHKNLGHGADRNQGRAKSSQSFTRHIPERIIEGRVATPLSESRLISAGSGEDYWYPEKAISPSLINEFMKH